jgi:hypothetical protein
MKTFEVGSFSMNPVHLRTRSWEMDRGRWVFIRGSALLSVGRDFQQIQGGQQIEKSVNAHTGGAPTISRTDGLPVDGRAELRMQRDYPQMAESRTADEGRWPKFVEMALARSAAIFS